MRLALYSQVRTVSNRDGETLSLFTKREEATSRSYGKLRDATPPHIAVAHVSDRRVTKADVERYLAAARR